MTGKNLVSFTTTLKFEKLDSQFNFKALEPLLAKSTENLVKCLIHFVEFIFP